MHFNRISLMTLLSFIQVSTLCLAQNVNWNRATPDNHHLVYANAGLNYGAIASLGYGYQLNIAVPVLLSAEFSIPFGHQPFDDLKSKLGGQVALLRAGNFSASVKAYGLFRRYESRLVRLESFGSETGAVFGYYKRKWFLAAELSFDKAITTHLVHGEAMRENNPGLKDGWYIPTGGNLQYGIQAGYSFGKNDLHLSAGKIVAQDFKAAPTLPFYLQLGCNRRF